MISHLYSFFERVQPRVPPSSSIVLLEIESQRAHFHPEREDLDRWHAKLTLLSLMHTRDGVSFLRYFENAWSWDVGPFGPQFVDALLEKYVPEERRQRQALTWYSSPLDESVILRTLLEGLNKIPLIAGLVLPNAQCCSNILRIERVHYVPWTKMRFSINSYAIMGLYHYQSFSISPFFSKQLLIHQSFGRFNLNRILLTDLSFDLSQHRFTIEITCAPFRFC